ncbi:hypothetical protein FOA52_005720 [Chlamydomonas sp. UWO 241]|nr:hypothetical protein FOA52_005720 [Chlamydomonas sp. UWO 241]
MALALLTARHAGASMVLPSTLTAMTSAEGETLLVTAKYNADAALLLENFVTQVNGAFCGPASATVVLNSLGAGQPMQPKGTYLDKEEYVYYTQESVFSDATEVVKPQSLVLRQGMSLSELSRFIAAHPQVNATHRYASDMTLDDFRSLLLSALSQSRTFAIVNFLRSALNESGGGHHSPVGAYNEAADSVLVMDVARYKYPAWWVAVADLYAATLSEQDGEDRGLVFVWTPPGDTPRVGAEYVTPGLDDGHAVRVVRVGALSGGGGGVSMWGAAMGAVLSFVAGVGLTAGAAWGVVLSGRASVAWGAGGRSDEELANLVSGAVGRR